VPVFRNGSFQPSGWCELRRYTTFDGTPTTDRIVTTAFPKAILLVTDGVCGVVRDGTEAVLRERDTTALSADVGNLRVLGSDGAFRCMLFEGNWGEDIGGCGLFFYAADTPRKFPSDPISYERTSNFDSHYHDCDEYWMILEGAGTVVVGGVHHDIGPGDCVVTGAGHHHDIPHIRTPIRSAFLETTLEGPKRRGHLHNFEHGIAVPRWERV